MEGRVGRKNLHGAYTIPRDEKARLARRANSLIPMVAGGRYELYSNYALQIQAVAASVVPA
jgi:hypothetical protein